MDEKLSCLPSPHAMRQLWILPSTSREPPSERVAMRFVWSRESTRRTAIGGMLAVFPLRHLNTSQPATPAQSSSNAAITRVLPFMGLLGHFTSVREHSD